MHYAATLRRSLRSSRAIGRHALAVKPGRQLLQPDRVKRPGLRLARQHAVPLGEQLGIRRQFGRELPLA